MADFAPSASMVFRDGESHSTATLSGYIASWTLVSLLFASCRPLAVFWAVVSIRVYSVYGMVFARSVSHIGKESIKRVHPFVTNGDSATAVMLPSVKRRVSATLTHLTPSFVFGCSTHAMRFFSSASAYFLQASTAIAFPTAKSASRYKFAVSTLANA